MKDDRDQEFNIWFVKEIEKTSCLYNHADPQYNNRMKQDEAWQNIANSAGASVTDCKERWKNLRACFTRHLKHRLLEIRTGIKHKRPYYLAQHMDFILPFTKLRSQPPADMHCIGEVAKRTTSPLNVVYVNNETDNEADDSRFFNESEIASYADTMYNSPESTPQPGNAETTGNIVDSKEENALFLKRKFPYEEEDPDINFLKSLLPDIRAMTSNQKRQFKIKVLTLTDEILNT